LSVVPTSIKQNLVDCGQEHLLKYWDQLNEHSKANLLTQIESIDFELLDSFAEMIRGSAGPIIGDEISPSPFISLDDPSIDWSRAKQDGEAMISQGKLGVLTVAGGQGTRLGWSGPKGTFPATPVTGKSLFQVVAEQILFASQKYNVTIPWYIMTSDENDQITRSFLQDNNCFGLDRTDIFVFPQGVVPAIDANGKMLLAEIDQIFMNPDGHGGVITALHRSGALEEMAARGVEHLAYVQIDNPLVNVVDPTFVGIHCSDHSSGEVSSKCVMKSSPDERVGVFCKRGDARSIIEYSDMTSEQTHEQKDGQLAYCCGSIAAHLFSTGFIENAASDLPWHVAHKAISHIDSSTGDKVISEEPNAYKFERFVFDVLPLASNSIVLQTKREDEFAPIKNANGNDSAQTSMKLQRERAITWLRACGVVVSEDAIIEISPTTAASIEDLREMELPTEIGEGEVVLL
jgi:UDP-N-acetylglucosamine/UDP-N-acetylgalactosamine diphosphorylase